MGHSVYAGSNDVEKSYELIIFILNQCLRIEFQDVVWNICVKTLI